MQNNMGLSEKAKRIRPLEIFLDDIDRDGYKGSRFTLIKEEK